MRPATARPGRRLTDPVPGEVQTRRVGPATPWRIPRWRCDTLRGPFGHPRPGIRRSCFAGRPPTNFGGGGCHASPGTVSGRRKPSAMPDRRAAGRNVLDDEIGHGSFSLPLYSLNVASSILQQRPPSQGTRRGPSPPLPELAPTRSPAPRGVPHRSRRFLRGPRFSPLAPSPTAPASREPPELDCAD